MLDGAIVGELTRLKLAAVLDQAISLKMKLQQNKI